MIAQKARRFTEASVIAALQTLQLPWLAENYVALKAISAIDIHENSIDISITLGFKANSQHHLLAMALASQLEDAGLPGINVRINSDVYASPSITRQGHMAAVKNIVMVASG